MKNEAIVMTVDFGINYFNALLLDKQLKLISSNGNILTLRDDEPWTVREQTEEAFKKLVDFFKR